MMGFSTMPVSGSFEAKGSVVQGCNTQVRQLEKLHFRSSDFPTVMKEAADLFDTTLSIAGLQAKAFPTVDLAEPFAASARLLAQLEGGTDVDRYREDLRHSAEALRAVTPEEAFHFQTFNRDYLSPQRLKELDHATHGRFSWVSDIPEDDRQEWALALFAQVAVQLNLADLFETMPDPANADQDMHKAWRAHRQAWLRDTVADLPDYAARRDDTAALRAILCDLEAGPARTNLLFDTALFDLLLEKDLRRTGETLLKLRDVSGNIKYDSESIYYEHHPKLGVCDWVWLIQTTGKPQIYCPDAQTPILEEAVRREPEDYTATCFSRQQQERAEARAKKAARNRGSEDVMTDAATAPSKGLMKSIRGWLKGA